MQPFGSKALNLKRMSESDVHFRLSELLSAINTSELTFSLAFRIRYADSSPQTAVFFLSNTEFSALKIEVNTINTKSVTVAVFFTFRVPISFNTVIYPPDILQSFTSDRYSGNYNEEED
jgi:hypothetical protein